MIMILIAPIFLIILITIFFYFFKLIKKVT